MAYSYLVLKKFVPGINWALSGSIFRTSLSYKKNCLALLFEGKKGKDIALLVELNPGREIIEIRDQYNPPKKNYSELFLSLRGSKIQGAYLQHLERVINLEFENDFLLSIRLFGSNSNLRLSQSGKQVEGFKTKEERSGAGPDQRPASITIDHMISNAAALKKSIPFVDKWTAQYLQSKDFFELSLERQQTVLNEIFLDENPPFELFIHPDDPPQLSPFQLGGWASLGTDPIISFREYAWRSRNYFEFKKPRESEIKKRKKEIQKLDELLRRLEKDLSQKLASDPFSKKADLLMANLHIFQEGINEADVDDFYTGKKIKLKIKENISPQKQAEKWYSKSKNRNLEIEQLEERLRKNKELLSKKQEDLKMISSIDSIREFNKMSKKAERTPSPSQERQNLPYKVHNFLGYEIRVGRSGAKNDLLLNSFSKRSDLWFHVRDAAGSHVILVRSPEESMPEEVIQRAAGLAIYNSKRRNEMNCPVIMTERKYVRKIKGAAPGLVKVEREKVVFANPVNS